MYAIYTLGLNALHLSELVRMVGKEKEKTMIEERERSRVGSIYELVIPASLAISGASAKWEFCPYLCLKKMALCQSSRSIVSFHPTFNFDKK